MIICNPYKSIHETLQVTSYQFLRYLQVSTDWRIQGSVRVSDSGFPTLYSFDHIYNDITYVNISPLFLTTLNLELQIKNQHCEPNI